MLAKRKIANIRYRDDSALHTLGLFDDIYWMLDLVGWTQLSKMKYPTYDRLTLEFLSSIKVNVLYGPRCKEEVITFRLFI